VQEREDCLVKRISRLENERKEWSKQMNELRVRGSEVECELTRLASDKMRLEEELRRAMEKQADLIRDHITAEETIRTLEKQVVSIFFSKVP